mgnify:CR=1 FL=1
MYIFFFQSKNAPTNTVTKFPNISPRRKWPFYRLYKDFHETIINKKRKRREKKTRTPSSVEKKKKRKLGAQPGEPLVKLQFHRESSVFSKGINYSKRNRTRCILFLLVIPMLAIERRRTNHRALSLRSIPHRKSPRSSRRTEKRENEKRENVEKNPLGKSARV